MASHQISSRPHVARSFVFGLAVLGGLAADGMAQTTHVVGTGGTYATIRAAIAAAAPGDTVLVNGGTWSESLVIDRGLRLVGRGAVLRGSAFGYDVSIQNLPAGEIVVVTGFQADGTANQLDTRVRAIDCDGLVTIERLTQGGLQQWFLDATNCAQLQLSGIVFAGARLDSCTTVMNGCVLDPDLFDGLYLTRCRVAINSCSIRAGLGIFPGAGIAATDSELALTQSTVSATGASNPAIRTTGGIVLLAPTTTLTPTGNRPPVGGTAAVAPFHFASVTARTDGQRLSFATAGPPGEAFLTLLSLPQPVTTTTYGFAWIDPVQWGVLQSGTFPTTGAVPGLLNHPTLPPGLAVTIQAVHLTPNGLALSTPAIVAAP